MKKLIKVSLCLFLSCSVLGQKKISDLTETNSAPPATSYIELSVPSGASNVSRKMSLSNIAKNTGTNLVAPVIGEATGTSLDLTNSLQLRNVTASRVAVYDASGYLTNAQITEANILTESEAAIAYQLLDTDLTRVANIFSYSGDLMMRDVTGWTNLQTGASNYVLTLRGNPLLPSWAASSGSGSITGPASSTSNAIAIWDNTTGTSLTNTPVSVNPTSGVITASNVITTASGSSEMTSLQITNSLKLLNVTGSRVAVFDSDGNLTNDVAATGSGSLVRADSPTFTSPSLGSATATTPPENDNDLSVATTAYVQTEIATLGGSSSLTYDISIDTMTSNNTLTTIYTNSITSNYTKMFVSDVIAAGPTNFGSWRILANISDRAGSQSGYTNQLVSMTSSNSLTAYFERDTTNIFLKVLGLTNENIHWISRGFVYSASNELAYAAPVTNTVDSPDDVTGLTLWLKSESLTNYAQGDYITTWSDSSGNNYHLTNSAHYPTMQTNVPTGLQSATFINTGDSLSNLAITVAQPLTVIVLANHYDGSVNYPALFDSATGGDMTVYLKSTGELPVIAAATAVEGTIAIPVNEWIVFTATFNGASSSLRTNMSAAITGDPGANGLAGIVLGNLSGGNVATRWRIAEVLIYNTAVSSNDVVSLEQYITNKFSISW